MKTPGLVHLIRTAIAAEADPVRAVGMQRYMKSTMPYRGVPTPVLRPLLLGLFREHPLPSLDAWRAAVLELWRDARYREERYAAIGLAEDRRYRQYLTFESIPMLEEMMVSGAWWDYVDTLATHHLGAVLRHELTRRPARIHALLRRWARGPDLWKRRAAILSQLLYKEETDLTLLYDCIEPSLPAAAGDADVIQKDFFIRKGIGWALRQYAWTDPEEVTRYVRANQARLSPLTQREAMKNIGGLAEVAAIPPGPRRKSTPRAPRSGRLRR